MTSPIMFAGPPWWFWLFAVVAAASVSTAVAVGVIFVLRSVLRGGPTRGPWRGSWKEPGFGPPPGTKLEHLLALRFAKGEIDEEEFRHRLEVLRSWRSERHGNWEQAGGG